MVLKLLFIADSEFVSVLLENSPFTESVKLPNCLVRDANASIVTSEGYLVSPGISIPENATSIIIGENGDIEVSVPDQAPLVLIGTLDMVTFINEIGLEEEGNNLLKETQASGAPISVIAGENGAGKILHHFLEGANVDPLICLTELLRANRAYELALKALNFTIEHMKLNNTAANV